MEFRTLKPHELDKWLHHCNDVFATPYEYFERHINNDPDTNYDSIFVAVDGDELASTIRVFLRTIYINGQAVQMGGIGEVSTKLQYRGLGLSSKLLKMCTDYMTTHNIPVSILFAGPRHHYAHEGWNSVSRRFTTVNLQGKKLKDGFVLRGVVDEDWSTIRGIYAMYASQFNGSIVRASMEYWDNWVKAELKTPMVLTHDGNIVAYLGYEVSGEDEKRHATISEYGAVEGGCELLLDILDELYARGAIPQKVTCAVPLIGETGWISEEDGMMVRLNMPFSIAEGAIDTVGKLKALFSDTVSFKTDGF